jgi:DNA-binding CsgD family transcriptional regulator
MWVSRSVVSRAVEALLAGRQPWPPSGLLAGARLSRREVEVLGLTASGLSNQDTARRLGIAEATVKAHLTRVFRRVGVRNRVQLAALYHQGRRQDHRPEA